jgi:hypothetical protein
MRLARPRIRTLLVAVTSAAMGLAASSYIANMDEYPCCSTSVVMPFWYSAEALGTAAVIGVGIHVAILVVLALLPRMTTRRWMVAIAIVAALLAVGVYQSHVADQWCAVAAKYRAVAECHESQSHAVAGARHWSGPLDGDSTISIGCVGCGPEGDEELKGRDLAIFLWHQRLSKKYETAAFCPWIAVPPDPPEPN